MKTMHFLGLATLLAISGTQMALAETPAEKQDRCEQQRLQCIKDHQGYVTKNIHGVRGMPVWVVEKCGKVKMQCIKGH